MATTSPTYIRPVKRLFDVVVSFFALIILSPLLLILAVMTYFNMGAPVLFRQSRAGLNGKTFNLIKFRSMRDARDRAGQLKSDAERLTKFGKWLRSSSLDELPELWNILMGDMSLVGPRPLLAEYLELYSAEQARRHHVRPGLTGWAQVNGRNELSWDEKFKLDVWYVDNQSFILDLRIMFLTGAGVLSRDGISAVGAATSPKFNGSVDND